MAEKRFGSIRWFTPAVLLLAVLSAQPRSLLSPSDAKPVDSQAHVIAAQGQVSIDRDSRPWAISSGETIGTQRVLTTGSDGFARLQVSDGSSFEVYSNSKVLFRENRGNSGDLLDVLAGRVRIHLLPGEGKQQRIYCRSAIVTAHEAATIAVAIDEDGSVRIDVLEGQVAVQHALLPRSEPTLVRAIDAIVVEKDEQISRRIERGTLYRHTVKPLHDLFETLLSGRGSPKVQEQPFAPEFSVAEVERP